MAGVVADVGHMYEWYEWGVTCDDVTWLMLCDGYKFDVAEPQLLHDAADGNIDAGKRGESVRNYLYFTVYTKAKGSKDKRKREPLHDDDNDYGGKCKETRQKLKISENFRQPSILSGCDGGWKKLRTLCQSIFFKPTFRWTGKIIDGLYWPQCT